MKIDFTNRRVLVTGSTSGIGFAAARSFLEAGATVVINGRSKDSVAKALGRLKEFSKVSGFVGDLSQAEACSGLIAEHPFFDVVVNNVGIYGPQDFFEMPDSEWDRFFQTNVMSGVRLSKAYAQPMVKRGWGRIVFISSESAINIPSDMIHYGFTKTAQLSISRGLAKRLAGTGVTVNSVLPGPTLSEGVAKMLMPNGEQSKEALQAAAKDFVVEHRSSSIIGRAATVEEVASMIIYVCSDQASATTGAALRVDGGVVESII